MIDCTAYPGTVPVNGESAPTYWLTSRLSNAEGKMKALAQELGKFEQKLVDIERKVGRFDQKFEQFDQKLGNLEVATRATKDEARSLEPMKRYYREVQDQALEERMEYEKERQKASCENANLEKMSPYDRKIHRSICSDRHLAELRELWKWKQSTGRDISPS